MKLEKLIFANKNIKRQLDVHFRGNNCRFKDGRDRIINAKPIGYSDVVMVSTVEDPFNDERREGHPYYINLHVDRENYVEGILTEEEAALILGVDFLPSIGPKYIHAMLEACVRGPRLSNAYVLGVVNHFGEIKRPPVGEFVIIPIQYYSISKRDYNSLTLTKREIEKAKKNLTQQPK